MCARRTLGEARPRLPLPFRLATLDRAPIHAQNVEAQVQGGGRRTRETTAVTPDERWVHTGRISDRSGALERERAFSPRARATGRPAEVGAIPSIRGCDRAWQSVGRRSP